jgi:iron-sulfur cluster assembly protein/iron-sulfur cluster insertion protein
VITNEPTTEVQPVLLTSAAAAKVQELITADGDDAMALRLAVRPGGCSGFSYEMYLDSEIADSDVVGETDGVRVVVDQDSAQMISGASIDFKDMGLQGGGFAIENPNQERSCGCGQSFC